MSGSLIRLLGAKVVATIHTGAIDKDELVLVAHPKCSSVNACGSVTKETAAAQ